MAHRLLVAPRYVGSSRIRDQTCVPCIGRWIPIHCVTKEVSHSVFFMSWKPHQKRTPGKLEGQTLRGQVCIPLPRQRGPSPTGASRSALHGSRYTEALRLVPQPQSAAPLGQGLGDAGSKGWCPIRQHLGMHWPQQDNAHEQALPPRPPDCSTAPTWVQDGLNDVPVAPLGLHALQLLGLVALAALLLLLLPGVLQGGAGWENERGSGLAPRSPLMCPSFLQLELSLLSLTIYARYK